MPDDAVKKIFTDYFDELSKNYYVESQFGYLDPNGSIAASIATCLTINKILKEVKNDT